MRFNLLSTAVFASLVTAVLARANFCPEAARFGKVDLSRFRDGAVDSAAQ
jgi:hypothetical protein